MVAAGTRDPRFEPQHWLSLIYQLYIEIEKTIIKKKRPGMAHSIEKHVHGRRHGTASLSDQPLATGAALIKKLLLTKIISLRCIRLNFFFHL